MSDPIVAPASPRSTNWMPSRKAISAGIGGVLSGLVATAAAKYGYPIPPDLLPYLAAGIMWLIYYIVPVSKQDIVRNLDNEIVGLAVNDPKSPVSLPGIAQATSIVQGAAAGAKAAAVDPNAGNFSDSARG